MPGGPRGARERELAEEIAVATWRRWRLRRAEGELWAVRCGSDADALLTLGEAMASDCDSTANAIEKLRRWWQGNERHLHRCTERLRLMQRLGDLGVTRRPRQDGLSRLMHADIARPLPGQLPDGSFPRSMPDRFASAAPESQYEIGNSADRTQCNEVLADQQNGDESGESPEPVSQLPPLPGAPLTRTERRRRMREQKKRERKAAKRAANDTRLIDPPRRLH